MKILFLDADVANHLLIKQKNSKHTIHFMYDVDSTIRALSTYDYDICILNINVKLNSLVRWLTKELSQRKRPYTTLFVFNSADRAASYVAADALFDENYYVIIKPAIEKENVDYLLQHLPPTRKI